MAKDLFRARSDRELRALDMRLFIDPGFVHRRRIHAVIGNGGISVVDEMINKLPTFQSGCAR